MDNKATINDGVYKKDGDIGENVHNMASGNMEEAACQGDYTTCFDNAGIIKRTLSRIGLYNHVLGMKNQIGNHCENSRIAEGNIRIIPSGRKFYTKVYSIVRKEREELESQSCEDR